MQIFQKSEGTADLRRQIFVCVDTDGAYVTGATFSAGELKVSKNGGTEASQAGSVTEIAQGAYYYEYTAGELDTAGFINLRTNKSGIVNRHFPAQVIDNNLNGNLNADIESIDDNTAVVAILKAIYSSCPQITVETANVAATTTSFQATGTTEQTADHYNGRQLIWTSGAMLASAHRITDYSWDAANSEGIFTVSTMQEVPADGVTAIIV